MRESLPVDDYTMYLDGGTWKLWQYALIEGFERSPTCPGGPDATVSVPPTTLAPAP